MILGCKNYFFQGKSFFVMFGLSIFSHERSLLFHCWNRLRGFIFVGAMIALFDKK